tara:strand:- start:13 stop:222 length:210 start_codon:yes stop_codon:yes gene_type:complete
MDKVIMNKAIPLAQIIIKLIDEEIDRLEPVMDDYDGGQIEGLRKARAIACNAERTRDYFYEYKDTSGCF